MLINCTAPLSIAELALYKFTITITITYSLVKKTHVRFAHMRLKINSPHHNAHVHTS